MTRDLLSGVWRHPRRRPEWSPAEWEAVLGQARQSRLLGRLAQHHADNGWLLDVPQRPRRILDGALRLVERQQREVRWEVSCLLLALQDVDTPVVLLKGAAYVVAGLPPRHGRLFADIDIMVRRDRLAEVEGALLRSGWISEERDPYNQRYYRQWMHELPPLKHIQRGTVIDVHHTITPPTSRFAVDGARLLDGVMPATSSPGGAVLAPVDIVLHSAVHLFQEGDFTHGLRDLLDLDDLLRHFGELPGFWPMLFARARTLGLGEPLHHALHHIEQRFGTVVPAIARPDLLEVRPGRLSRTFLTPLLTAALDPSHPSCDRAGSRLARQLLYVRAHLLRMPLRLAVPHLIRKAWMRQFVNRTPPAAV